MLNYIPEHGDVYILQDRPSLGFSANGQNNTVTPNPWYVAGETINKGTVVSIANIAYALAVTGNSADAGKVFETKPTNAVQCVGIALNTATYGQGLEVQDHGLYTFSSNFFSSSDLGNTVYVAPQPPDPVTNFAAQLTTNRNLASSSGTPLIEIGIALAANKLFIDFQGDTRGSVNLSQVSANAGEAISNTGVPLIVSIGSDGNAYIADRRKSANTAVITFQTLLGTATNITFGSINYSSPQATFTINSVAGATTGTIVIAGTTVTLGGGDIANTNAVAAKIAGTSFLPLWSVGAIGNTVTLTQISFPQSRNVPVGYIIGANTGFGPSSTIPQGTPIVIQKLGIATGFTGLLAGQALWLDINGTHTQNLATLSYYTDTATPVGYAQTSSSIYVSLGFSAQTADANPIGSIIAQNPSLAPVDYGYLACDGSFYDGTNPTYTPLWNVIGLTYGGSGQGHFQVPSLTFAGINFEIKYLNWYQYNPPIAPFFRYDTGWTQWGQLPIGTTGSAGVYIEIPTTQFGYDVPATDMFAEVYIQNAALTIVRQINPNPVYTGTTRYGFQILKDTANSIRLEFADGGLAYYASGGYTAIDNTWTYRIMLYKTERFNKFYDYLADQKLQQLWTLNLVNLTASITTAGPGYFDRGAVAPSGTTRLNYSGDFYATDFFSTANTTVGGNLSVTGTSGFSNTVTVGSLNIQTSGNLTTSGNLATTGSGQLSIGGTSGFTGLATFGALTANGAVTLNNTLTLKNGATTEFSVDTSGNVYTNGTITSVYTGGSTALSLQGTSSFAGLATFTNGFVVGAGGGTTGNSTFNLPIILNQALTQYNLGIQTFQALSNGNLSTTGSITTTGGSGNLSISGTSIFTGLMTVGVNGIDGPATTALYPTPTTITFGSNATTFSIGNATGGGAGNLTLYSASTVLSGNTSVTSGTLTLGSSSRDGLLNFYTNGGSGVNAFISNSTSAKTLTISQNLNSGNVIVQIFGATVATFNQTGVIAAGFDTTSKRALKDNIQKFDEKAMNILSKIEVVSYNFKADPQKKLKIGFIADDTHEYLSGKEHDRMDISNTLGLLIKAVQELKNEVDEIRRGY